MNPPLTRYNNGYNCAGKLFKTGYMSDISIFVGESKTNSTRFPAHKLFMSLTSPVFSAMLEDKFIENETGEILITDITPLAFNALLRFIYTDEFNENITISEYAQILYAAKKYMMEPLTNCCLEKLANREVDFGNFWSFYYIVNTFFSEVMPPDLVIKILKFLSDNSEELLCCDECVNVGSDIVEKIVESEAVKVNSELTMINFILNWSRMECYRQKLDVTFDNRRKVLGDIIYKIRFLTLTIFELKNQCELLSLTEIDNILILLLNKNENDICLPDKNNDISHRWNKILLERKREGYSQQIYWFGEASSLTDPPLNNYKILIISAKDFVLKCLRLTPSTCTKLGIKVQISKINGDIVKQLKCNFESCKSNKDIFFDVKICLNAFTVYILDMEFEHGTLSKNKYDLNYCTDYGETVLVIEELSSCIKYDFKSPEYWQSVFNGKQDTKHSDCFVRGIGVYI